jgi:thioesterase domain-containing protein/acyl carrier protein
MVPQEFYLIEEFPTTLNGKIDRKALSNLSADESAEATFISPETESEKIVAAIWEECLGIDRIGIHSNFFELGGHSIIAVRVMTQLEKETGNRLPLVALLEHPTVRELAAHLDEKSISWDSLVPLKPKGTKVPLYIVHGAHHNVIIFNDLAQRMDQEQPVFAFQPKGLDGVAEPHESIDEMAAHFISEMEESNPDGPYALAGFSLGGIVAFEMARQLKAKGKEVKTLAMFDSYVFPYYYFKSPLKKKVVSGLYLLGKIFFIFFNMFSSKKNFQRRMELNKLLINGLFLRFKLGKEKQHELQHNRSLKLDIAHNQATDRYTITPQEVDIDLFRSTEEINFVHDSKFLGWSKVTPNEIRRHLIPGNHIDMFAPPNVDYFSSKLQEVLDNNNSDTSE